MQYPGLDPEIGKKDISGKTGEIQTQINFIRLKN